eukprot:9445167-Alexandrium_andersonii.AAC.1
MFNAFQRLRVPEAAPWLAEGVWVVCCWWSGTAWRPPRLPKLAQTASTAPIASNIQTAQPA